MRRCDLSAALAEFEVECLEGADGASVLVFELVFDFGILVEIGEYEAHDIVVFHREAGEGILTGDFEEPCLVRHLHIESEDCLHERLKRLPVVEVGVLVVDPSVVADEQAESFNRFFVLFTERKEVVGRLELLDSVYTFFLHVLDENSVGIAKELSDGLCHQEGVESIVSLIPHF